MTFFFDQNNTRLQKVVDNDLLDQDWLFFPGGPGLDSSCFNDLWVDFALPGRAWVVDFPECGSNFVKEYDPNYNFANWEHYLVEVLQRFKKPIVVGHSFGGVFLLLYPQIEAMIKAMVLIGSQPKYDNKATTQHANQYGMSYDSKVKYQFFEEQSSTNFLAMILAKANFYFPEQSLLQGTQLFNNTAFNYHALIWWTKMLKVVEPKVKWAPSKIPCIAMNGDFDFISPGFLFKEDQRFMRDNIKLIELANSGHFPWLENSAMVQQHIIKILDYCQ